jgi:hypothetical protein
MKPLLLIIALTFIGCTDKEISQFKARGQKLNNLPKFDRCEDGMSDYQRKKCDKYQEESDRLDRIIQGDE